MMFGELAYEKLMQSFMFRLPLTYVPKYLTNRKLNKIMKEDESFNKASLGAGKVVDWDIRVTVAAEANLTEIVSHVHPVKLMQNPDSVSIVLDFDRLNADKVATCDYEIYLKESAVNVPKALRDNTKVNGTQYTSLVVNYLPVIAKSSDKEAEQAIMDKILKQISASKDKFQPTEAVVIDELPKEDVVMKSMDDGDDDNDAELDPAEFIFLIDLSGSMFGYRRDGNSPVKLAQGALRLFLHSLPDGSKFNIVQYGSRFTSTFPTSVVYNEVNLEKALADVDTYHDRSMGGTNIHAPLESIFN